jgi:SAM-dependent methyltransferase
MTTFAELKCFDREDFARSFGVDPASLPMECLELIRKSDFSYSVPDGAERDAIILEILRKYDGDVQKIGSPERQNVWQRGWQENLDAFVNSNNDLASLVPKFIRPGLPIRLNGSFVRPTNPMFELAFLRVFRVWLFKTYFKDVYWVYEFGCGTGFNLVEMAQLFSQKNYVGLDFAPAAATLVTRIGEAYGWKMRGGIFDFKEPDPRLKLQKESAVFTFGALEQVAGEYDRFLEYLLKQQIGFCINIEPTIELYDETSLFDYLAIRFHKKRGYSMNYLTRLRELEASGKIVIEKVKRLNFGSLFMEGYTYMVWRPV